MAGTLKMVGPEKYTYVETQLRNGRPISRTEAE